jgi:hypothetical protein
MIEPLDHLIQTYFTVATGIIFRPDQLIPYSLRERKMPCSETLAVGKKSLNALPRLIKILRLLCYLNHIDDTCLDLGRRCFSSPIERDKATKGSLELVAARQHPPNPSQSGKFSFQLWVCRLVGSLVGLRRSLITIGYLLAYSLKHRNPPNSCEIRVGMRRSQSALLKS